MDLPEVSLVAIFDADKEGFLRSKRSLIQIVGRAARHVNGEVIMYADKVTDSMKNAIEETERRREIQQAYNQKNGIIPKSTKRELQSIADDVRKEVGENENWGKVGVTYSSTSGGFQEGGNNFEIESRFSRKKSKSIHSEEAPRKSFKAKQTYDDFDVIKEVNFRELQNKN
ncbi:MAG: hypothetical protein HC932_02570 [Thermales bacterium]|nr:hypothetical protein [Thermales bacterium]